MRKSLILLSILSILFCSKPVLAENNPKTTEENSKITQQLEKNPIKFGNKDFTIKIIDVYLEENPDVYEGQSIVFEYEYQNLRNDSINIDNDFDFFTDIVQDNDPNIIATLDWVPNKKYIPEDAFQVKPKGKAKWADAFKLDESKNKVILEAFDFNSSEKWGEWEFNTDDLKIKDSQEVATIKNTHETNNSKVSSKELITDSGETYYINPTNGIRIPIYRNTDGSYVLSKEHDPAYIDDTWQIVEDSYNEELDMSAVYGDDWQTNPDLNNEFHNDVPDDFTESEENSENYY